MKVAEFRKERIEETVEGLAVVSRYLVDQVKCEDMDWGTLKFIFETTTKLNLVDAHLSAELSLNGRLVVESWADRFGFVREFVAVRDRLMASEDGDS